MNKTEALALLQSGRHVQRQGSFGYWKLENGRTVYIHQNGTETIATMANYQDFILIEGGIQADNSEITGRTA